MQHFNEDFVSIISTLHTCFGTYRPSSNVNNALFIYANILKAVAIGHFSYQPNYCKYAVLYQHKKTEANQNMTLCDNKSIINTRHRRFIAAVETDCPQQEAWYTEESTRHKMYRWPTASDRSQLPI
jgi:hypothetical protein